MLKWWKKRSLRHSLKVDPQGWLLQRDRPSAEAANDGSVEESYDRAIENARVAATARCSRARRLGICRNQAGAASRAELGAMPGVDRMAHYEIDEVKMRVAEMLGPSFSQYSADEIAELEAAFRTDDPEELQRIYAKWADMPSIEREDPPQPDCLDCRRPMRAAIRPGSRMS